MLFNRLASEHGGSGKPSAQEKRRNLRRLVAGTLLVACVLRLAPFAFRKLGLFQQVLTPEQLQQMKLKQQQMQQLQQQAMF